MNLKTSLLAAGGVAAGLIGLTAAVVLTGPKPAAEPEAAQLTEAAAAAEEQPAPDPRASGVIIAISEGSYYWLTPSRERGSVSQFGYPDDGVSPDGRWQAGISWEEDEAFLTIFDQTDQLSPDAQKSVRFPASLIGAEWAPGGPLLAALDEEALYLVEPQSGEASVVAEGVTTYAWGAGDSLIFATADGIWGLDDLGGPVKLAALTAPLTRLYVSPERDQVLYTQNADEGWRLVSLNPRSGVSSDFGNLGSLRTATGLAIEAAAPQLAVAWSPDGSRFAVGPVSKPYAMHLVTPGAAKPVETHFFTEGYAGELAWSPDGSRLAISTYSLDRKQHEVYVMDASAGSAPRHLLDGCKIVWSPNGEFVAVKREPHDATGVAAIRVDSGYHWDVTTFSGFFPVAWGVDQEAAMSIALKPQPYAVQLGK